MKARDLIVNSMREWRTVNAPDLANQLFDRLDANEVYRLAMRGLTDEVRTELRTKDENGVPKYGSLEIVDRATGEKQRIYKQTSMFDVDEYRAVANYHIGEARAHLKTAEAIAGAASKRFGVQLEIPQLATGTDGA